MPLSRRRAGLTSRSAEDRDRFRPLSGGWAASVMTEQICEVIITADSEDWLVSFTRSLVEERLVACGQHVAPIRSIYRWERHGPR